MRAHRRNPGLLRSAGALGLLLAAASAAAQPRTDAPRDARPARPETLRNRLGLASAERWLASTSTAERLRAIERLGSDASPRALGLLAKALAPGGTATSVEERLVAARVLAPQATTNVGRQTLIRLMSGSGAAADDSDDLEQLARLTAALALADSGDREAMTALARAVRHEGSVSQTAATALAAHPPADLGVILGAAGRSTPTLVELLDELLDERAEPALREFVRHGSEPIRARAALALGRLGDPDTIGLARFWLERSDSAVLRRAAAELLALGHADDAPRAIAALLASPATRSAGLDLAFRYPARSLVAPLLGVLDTLDDVDRARALAILGRTTSTDAVARLARELRGNDGDLAAYALAQCPAPEAGAALVAAMRDPATARDAVRAGALRALALHEEPDGLRDAVDRLLRSKDASDRAAAAWAAAALDAGRRRELLASEDPVVAAAAARTARDRASLIVEAGLLARARSPELVATLSGALEDLDAANGVSTATLLQLLENVPATAPLAARALAARGGADLESTLDELLASGDALIRAHTALGLGATADPSAVGRLDEAYRFEADPTVRRAVVRALAMRREPTRRRTLDLAARLDPDAETRNLAGSALRGATLPVTAAGDAALWLGLRDSSDVSGAQASRSVAIVTPTGLALPMRSDPDGRLTLWGLPRGPVAVRLAPAAAREEASVPGPKHTAASR